MNTSIFPQIYTYQSGGVAARYLRDELKAPFSQVIIYTRMNGTNQALFGHSFCFNANCIVKGAKTYEDLLSVLEKGDNWLYTDEVGLAELNEKGYHPEVVKEMPKFHISILSARFANPTTRLATLQKVYLVKLQSSQFVIPLHSI